MAEKSGDVWFAYDTYAEFIRSFAVHVLNIREEYFQEALNIYEKDQLSGDEMVRAVQRYKEIVNKHGAGKTIPENRIDQIMMAVDAVYASWDSSDAKAYRARHKISRAWGTVVILQKGVFGNISERGGQLSGSGHAVLREMPDGRDVVKGKFRIRGMGHDVMSRAMNYILLSNSQRNPDAHEKERTMEDEHPEIYRAILDQGRRLKEVFGNNPEFEFVLELGKLWITQSNDDVVTVDYPEFVDSEQNVVLGRGHGFSGGAFRGWVANSVVKVHELLEKYRRERPAGVDGVILFVNRVNPVMINMLPTDVALCIKISSAHAETVAQKSGMSALYDVTDMVYKEDEGVWYIGPHKMEEGLVISIDGHENQLVYHNGGRIFLGSVPLTVQAKGEGQVFPFVDAKSLSLVEEAA